MNYAKQSDKFRCGPYAMLNIMKWAGIKKIRGKNVNVKLIKYLTKICNCVDGTFQKDLIKAIEIIPNINKKLVRNINRKTIINHIMDGGIILFCFSYLSGEVLVGHYSLIVDYENYDYDEERFLFINHKRKTYYWMKSYEFTQIFENRFSRPYGWLISKKNVSETY